MAFLKECTVRTNLDKENFKRLVEILNNKNHIDRNKIKWHTGSLFNYAYVTTFRFEGKLFKFSEYNEIVEEIIDTSAPFKSTYHADVDFLFEK